MFSNKEFWTALSLATVVMLGIASSEAQNVPSVNLPPRIAYPANSVAQGLVWTPGQWNTGLKSQGNVISFYGSTVAASAVTLTTDGLAVSADNVGKLTASLSIGYTANCAIVDAANRKTNTYSFAQSLITAAADGTVAVSSGNPTAVTGPTTTSALSLVAVPAIAADNTNKGWAITFTPPSGNTDTISAMCVLRYIVVS